MGTLVVVSGPSGAGKTSIVAGALARRPDVVLSTSATTRAPRHDEVNGRNYLFVSADMFEQIRRSGGFLEIAEVHGNLYGTPKDPVEEALADGRTVVLEIDVQGAASIRETIPEAILVFVRPPSPTELRDRLEVRGTDTPAVIEERLRNARDELAQAGRFDHQIVNDDLEEAISQLIRILDESPEANPGPAGSGSTGPQGESI